MVFEERERKKGREEGKECEKGENVEKKSERKNIAQINNYKGMNIGYRSIKVDTY